MHGFGATLASGFDQPLDIEIAVARTRRSEQYGFVGQGDMHRGAVGFGIDRHRAQAHRFRRANHPACDFTAIGDQ